MSDHSKSPLNRIFLTILVLSLFFGLASLTDFDFDGVIESFLAETDLTMPAILWVALSSIFVSLAKMIPLAPRSPFSYLLVPPPIQ